MDLPVAIPPMLLSAAHYPPVRPAFLYEVKWDGIRCVAFVEQEVRLQSRSLHPIGGRFPEIARNLSTLQRGTVLDGELIVLQSGRPCFERVRRRLVLQDPRRIAQALAQEPAIFMAFDLLFQGGTPLLRRPFEERRARLAETVAESKNIAVSPLYENGEELYDAVCAQGLEGIVAKRRDSIYLPGKRALAWVKCKTPAARAAEQKRFACA